MQCNVSPTLVEDSQILKKNYNLDSNLHFMFQQLSQMEWTDEKDLLLVQQVLLLEPFKHKPGSKDRGFLCTQVSKNLNSHPGFSVTQRAVSDRFGILEKKAKKRRNEIEKSSGISPEDSELGLALQGIDEKNV